MSQTQAKKVTTFKRFTTEEDNNLISALNAGFTTEETSKYLKRSKDSIINRKFLLIQHKLIDKNKRFKHSKGSSRHHKTLSKLLNKTDNVINSSEKEKEDVNIKISSNNNKAKAKAKVKSLSVSAFSDTINAIADVAKAKNVSVEIEINGNKIKAKFIK